MFPAELRWLASGLTLKMDGKLVGDWAEEAMRLITTQVVPQGLIVDLTDVSYVDSAGECLLAWLGSVGAIFVAPNVYAIAVCERLGLPAQYRITSAQRLKDENPSTMHTIQCDAGAALHHEEGK